MPNKKTVYLILVVFLGCLLGDILYDMVEVSYLSIAMAQRDSLYVVYGDNFFALRPLPEMIFVLIGMYLGYHAGKSWWRIIYVEDRRHRHYKMDW